MLDAEYEGPACVSAEPSSDRPARKQYTLKGVEEETLRLMKDAAGKEGMKIGSWVSIRMREAAERALRSEGSDKNLPAKLPSPDEGGEIAQEICILINAQREEAEARFLRLERELHEITSVQRSILTSLLKAK